MAIHPPYPNMPQPLATLTLDLPDEAATRRFGAVLAHLLRPGDIVLLDGSYGAGKSTLARAILRSMAGDPALDVPSPSFTLVQEYETPAGDVRHYDLWRISNPGELAELGWGPGSEAINLVEWPEKLGRLRPSQAMTIALSNTGEESRQAAISAPTEQIAALRAAMASDSGGTA